MQDIELARISQEAADLVAVGEDGRCPSWVKGGPILSQARLSSKGPLSDQVLDAPNSHGQCRSWVEPSRSGARPGRSGIGASRPLWRIPAIVSFLNPQPALSLVGGNGSSCPFAVIRHRHPDRLKRVDSGHSRFALPVMPRRQSGHLLPEGLPRHDAYFSAIAGRPEDRSLSSPIRGCRSSKARITAWT